LCKRTIDLYDRVSVSGLALPAESTSYSNSVGQQAMRWVRHAWRTRRV
jgi:hypothetical protein